MKSNQSSFIIHGVSIVGVISDLCFASITSALYGISSYIEPHYQENKIIFF